MKKFKESRTSPRQIYRTVNGLRNDLQHESTEDLKVLVDQTLFQFGLKYDGDIYRKLNTGDEYPYHVWKALPTQNLTQRWLIGIWPGFDGHDYQFKIYAADTLDQIKNNEVEPLAEYEGTNSIDELISDLEDAFKYFINEDFKEFQKYPQEEWDQMVKEGRVDENGNLRDETFELIVDENDPICDQFHICSRGDFDAYMASLDHPLDESEKMRGEKMRFLMNGYGMDPVDIPVKSEEEAVDRFFILSDKYLDGRSSNELYSVILKDDGSMLNISHNGTVDPMEDFCSKWISRESPFAQEIIKLGYKGPFKGEAIKGHFSKDKAVQLAKENTMKEQKLKEDRFDRLEYLYIDGSYALIRKYEQGPFLKKILNGNVFDRLYRYVSAGKLKTKDNPFNVKNWKVGNDILLGLTSTLPFEDPKNLKKDLQVNFSYCMVFKDVKGYSVKYDTKDFVGWGRGIERYKWQKEVLTAGLFHVDNIEQKGKITYVELSTVKQDKETFIEILRKTKKDLESGEFNKQYPTELGVKYATYDRLKKLLKGTDLEIFNINNLSQKEIEAIKKLPKINTYGDLYYFIKEYGLYKDLKPMCTEEPPKEFTKEVWNNTLVDYHIALPEEAFPQSKKEAFNEWNGGNYYERMEKEWPEVTGKPIPFQNYLEGLHFIADKYFALKNIKEKLEKDSLKESMRKTLKEFDGDWMNDGAKLNAVKVEDLIEDKYLDKALKYYELFEELTLRGDYKKAEDRSEEDIEKDQKAIELLKKLQRNTDPALAYGFMLYDESSITKAYWTKRVGDRKDPHTKKPWVRQDKQIEWLCEIYLVLTDQNPKFKDHLYYYKFTDSTGRFNIMNNFKLHWNKYMLSEINKYIFKRNVKDYKSLGDSKDDFEITADYSDGDIEDFLLVEDFIKYFAKKGSIKANSGGSLRGLTWKKVLEEIIKNKEGTAVELSKILGVPSSSMLRKLRDELKKDMKKFDIDQDIFAEYISKYDSVALDILNGKDATFSDTLE